MVQMINFVTVDDKLKELAYNDSVYAWLLLHSHYDKNENHNYIYKRDFTFKQIAKDIGRNEKTVSKRFKELLDDHGDEENGRPFKHNFISWSENWDYYILPCFRDFQKLHAETVFNLFRLCGSSQTGVKRREELIKTYAWLKKQMERGNKDLSLEDMRRAFDYSKGNGSLYTKFKDILTTLQGAGLISFRTGMNGRNEKGQFGKTLYVYKVNDKASKEWLDKQEEEDRKD